MSLYSFYRISKPSADKVPGSHVQDAYKSLRNRTFWGATVAYSLYYVCRMSINVVKQPLIDEGVLSAGELGLIGSALLFVYAVGKFLNGFIADYCNIRRFMATGLFISAIVNLLRHSMGHQRMDAVHGFGSGSHKPVALVPSVQERFVLQSFQHKSIHRRVPFI